MPLTEGFWPAIVAVTLGVITVAIVAVVLSPNAQTGSVISAYAQGITSMINAATAPVQSNNGSIH